MNPRHRCPTNHRNARTGPCQRKPTPQRDRRSVVTEWAWCPDCERVVLRQLVVHYSGGWEVADDGHRPPLPVDRWRESA